METFKRQRFLILTENPSSFPAKVRFTLRISRQLQETDGSRRPCYRGGGRSLVSLAAYYSFKTGFSGRVTLTSLPDAEEFYLQRGFRVTKRHWNRTIDMELPHEMSLVLAQILREQEVM